MTGIMSDHLFQSVFRLQEKIEIACDSGGSAINMAAGKR